MSRQTSSFLSAAVAVLFACGSLATATAAEPNDTFADRTILTAGTLTLSDTIDGGSSGDAPDTYLGFFSDDSFPLPPLAEDDDSSPVGDGLADAIFNILVNADGSIPLAVTGCCDDFDGSHEEDGDYELFVDVFDATGAMIDSFSAKSTLAQGQIDQFPFSNPDWIGGTFTAIIDNTVGIGGDGTDSLDYWVFTGLTPGASYVAETISGDFDTILAVFAPDGTLLETDDDAGVGLLSQLNVTASAAGELYLAVTGYSDFDLSGIHGETGDYELTVTIVPEPASLTLFLAGVATLFWGCRRQVA